ncbi:hypothetical protein D3C75_410270 [compost metagenome]
MSIVVNTQLGERVDVTQLKDGDEVHYLGHSDKTPFKAIIETGLVKGDNIYNEGVFVYGDDWKQYVSMWFIVKVCRNGETIYEKDVS